MVFISFFSLFCFYIDANWVYRVQQTTTPRLAISSTCLYSLHTIFQDSQSSPNFIHRVASIKFHLTTSLQASSQLVKMDPRYVDSLPPVLRAIIITTIKFQRSLS